MKMYDVLRGRFSYPLLLIIALFLAWRGAPLSAQNATISPEMGNLVAAYTWGVSEVGFERGLSALWQHKQLPITYSTSDAPTLSKDGVMGNHTCNFHYYAKKDGHGVPGPRKLIHFAGKHPTYTCLALPHGYTIQGYRIVIKNNLKTPDDNPLFDILGGKVPFGRLKDWTFGEVEKSNVILSGAPVNPTFKPGYSVTLSASNVSNTNTFTIERHGTDLGHILYFCLAGNTGHGRTAAFTYESIELWFTANTNFEYKLQPAMEYTKAVSLSANDMPLGKMDLGELKSRTKNGRTYFCYDQDESREVMATVNLFEEGAHNAGTWSANHGQKKIRVVESNNEPWYILKDGTYYVEAPNSAMVRSKDGETKMSVGYRIVGAKVHYRKGQYKDAGFTLRASYGGLSDYFLDGRCEWTKTPVTWHTNAAGELYTIVDGVIKYMWFDRPDPSKKEFDVKISETNKHARVRWAGNRPYIHYPGLGYENLYLRLHIGDKKAVMHEDAFQSTDPYAVRGDVVLGVGQSTNFRITTYGPSGEASDPQTRMVTVAGGTQEGAFFVGNKFNNDAIKFKIEPYGGGSTDAMVNISLIMEPLNPYIKSVDVVCHGAHNVEQVRTFEATDFNLGGEKFTFKVPKGLFTGAKFQFSFRNLKSDFADDTYGNCPGTHNSRYSFVQSDYYKAVNEDIYAHKDIVANYDYKKKVNVELAGNIAFPFNNAADLINTTSSGVKNYFSERPFSVAAYQAMTGKVETDINGHKSIKNESGKFVKENAQLQDKETKTMYLYTTDETRYNIAPTTKEQHRAFAYYHTVIKLEIGNYEAKVKWKSIYNKPMYYKNNAENHYQSTRMVGAEIQTTESGMEGNKHQLGATSEFGYLTLKQIIDVLKESIAKGTDYDVPKSLSEVLYVDNSKLFDVIPETHDQKLKPMLEGLRGELAKNALIFLPYRAESLASVDNVAIQRTDGKGFDGHSNIILTDKHPFFTPYNVQLKPEAYATYTRDVTVQGKGRVKFASVVLPYALSLDGSAMHSNAVGQQSKFFLAKMKSNALTLKSEKKKEGADYDVVAKFDFLTSIPKSEANVPYIVMVAGGYGNGNVSFVATEKGALIEKTPTTQTGLVDGYEVQSKLDNTPVKFKSYYTYSGRVLNKAGNEMVFYFSLDRFVAFKNLKKSQLFLFPFRTFFHFENQGLHLAKSLNSFEIGLDGEEGSTSTDIDDVQEEVVLKVTVSTGQITAEATKNVPLAIYTMSGQCAARAMIKSGETRTFYLSPGVYLVNGKKMIVN